MMEKKIGDGRKRLLVVEDDPETRQLMRLVLRKKFDVVVASNGAEARNALAANRGAIRMILMDLMLGDAEDGLSLTRALRSQRRWRKLPIVAATACANPEDRAAVFAAGCNGYLPKPFSPHDLMATVERSLPDNPRQPTPK